IKAKTGLKFPRYCVSFQSIVDQRPSLKGGGYGIDFGWIHANAIQGLIILNFRLRILLLKVIIIAELDDKACLPKFIQTLSIKIFGNVQLLKLLMAFGDPLHISIVARLPFVQFLIRNQRFFKFSLFVIVKRKLIVLSKQPNRQ